LLVGGVVASKAILAPFHCKYENVLIPMRDGVRLAGDLYRPAMNGVPDECQWTRRAHTLCADQRPRHSDDLNAKVIFLLCRLHSARVFPCVLIRTPYNKGAENPDLRNPGTCGLCLRHRIAPSPHAASEGSLTATVCA
jgi:hypothetical protein